MPPNRYGFAAITTEFMSDDLSRKSTSVKPTA